MILLINIEALCAASPEALAHSPSQMLPSCAPISARAAQRRRRRWWWSGEEEEGARRPGFEGQVLRHVLWHVSATSSATSCAASFTSPSFKSCPREVRRAECMCFILPPCTTRGRRSSNVQLGSACARMPLYCLASSVVVVGVEGRPPFGDLGCALRRRLATVLRSQPGVAPWLPHEGLANGEGGVVTSFCHPARSCARCAHSVSTVPEGGSGSRWH